MDVNTVFLKGYANRNISVVAPDTKTEAEGVLRELDQFCMGCPVDNSESYNCGDCPVYAMVATINMVFSLDPAANQPLFSASLLHNL